MLAEISIYLGLFAPLAGFLVLMLTSKWINRTLVSVIGCGTIFLAFLCFVTQVVDYSYHDIDIVTLKLYDWIPVHGIDAEFLLRVDTLSLLMTLIITGIGFLIHVYSIGYMEHEEDIARYFACMNFFVFAMLLLVLSGNLLLLFVGWEGVGLASYLLIGFWYERPVAAHAATKAFVINRIGDCGFLLGLLIMFYAVGTADITAIAQQVGDHFSLGTSILTLFTLLLFVGATGKSAQIPLQTWLPDAMAGPTPVSALIHAATMVTAGVYLVVRMHPVFILTPVTLHIIGIIGAATALFAALCAVGQTDLKRVLAYSTVSQLGLMFLACGIGAFYSAMFHLTTHAFMKSLLFLSAGNVVHMMHGTTEMSQMGGLAKIMPKTHILFLVGVLSMSGIPPLAAFFSKDLILELEHLAGFNTLFYIALAASILTAFYLTRAYCLTFLGPSRLDPSTRSTLKEAPQVMLWPVALLALFSTVGGFLGFSFGKTPILESFIAEVGITLEERELTTHFDLSPEMLMSIGGALIGVIVAAFMYLKYADRLGPTLQFLKRSFYIDEIYWALFVVPFRAIADAIAKFFEPKIFDGLIHVSTQATQKTAILLQKVQSGQIRSYVAWMAVGVAILIVYITRQ